MAHISAYNPVNGRIELKPDGGAGWMLGYRPLPPAPANVVRAVYVMRFWIEGFSPLLWSQLTDPGWSIANYIGFSWGTTPFVPNNYTAYVGFWGMAGLAWNGPVANPQVNLSARGADDVKNDFASFVEASPTTYDNAHTLTDGFGSFINRLDVRTSTGAISDYSMPWTTIPIGEAKGLECTYLWEVLRDEGTNRIRMNGRINTASLDIDALDLDGTDPNVSIPASNSWAFSNYEIMSAGQFGVSNPWIQTDAGPMSVPTHFTARWPWGTSFGRNLIIDKIRTKYYSSL